ncbi:unnamed protein product [Somion occarium]|uniref:F-box domain-containing protein n=1 Tax=Somion occarium TaxID=3059160 RepID=A0ABP1CY28_9APHY
MRFFVIFADRQINVKMIIEIVRNNNKRTCTLWPVVAVFINSVPELPHLFQSRSRVHDSVQAMNETSVNSVISTPPVDFTQLDQLCMTRDPHIMCRVQHAVQIAMEQRKLQIAEIAERWNALVPVHRLPMELLERIFLLVRDEWFLASLDVTSPDRKSRLPPYAWIKFSHVCRHWRRVSLQYTPLWNWIAFLESHTPLAAIQEMVLRSGQVPLLVGGIVDTWDTVDFTLKYLRGATDRICSLHVDAASHCVAQLDNQMKSLVEEFPEIWSSLRSLTLVERRTQFQNRLSTFHYFPDHLERLSLDTIFLDVKDLAPLRMTLRHLSLYNVSVWPSLSSFLDVLTKTPLLETLLVELKAPLDLANTTNEVHDVVPLHHLQLLDIRGLSFCTAYVLEHIQYPPTATLRLDTDFYYPGRQHTCESDLKGILRRVPMSSSFTNDDVQPVPAGSIRIDAKDVSSFVRGMLRTRLVL